VINYYELRRSEERNGKMIINWQPTVKQMQAWVYLEDKTTTELLFGGAAGGGKSVLGASWLTINSIRYPGSRWMMGRAVLKNLKQTTLLTFFDVCKRFGIKTNRDYKYNSMEGVIKWTNGSEIYLKDLFQYPSDPEFDSLGSTEYTGVFIDEASQVKAKAKTILLSRIRYKLDEFNIIPKMLIASNPSKNFLYKDFYKPWRDKIMQPYRKFIPSLVTDNPYLSDQYIENLKRMDKNSRERLLYGNWEYDDDPARMFEYDDLCDLFTNHVDKSDEKYLIIDAARGGGDKIVMGYWEGFLLKDIAYWQKASTVYSENRIKEWEEKKQVKRHHIAIDEDGIGGGILDHLPGCRGFVNNAKPIQKGVDKTNYRNLKSQCYFYLADFVRLGKIAVRTSDEQIKNWIIEELEQIKEINQDKDVKKEVIHKDEIKQNLGRSPDFSDMMMMRMLYHLASQKISVLQDPDNISGLF